MWQFFGFAVVAVLVIIIVGQNSSKPDSFMKKASVWLLGLIAALALGLYEFIQGLI